MTFWKRLFGDVTRWLPGRRRRRGRGYEPKKDLPQQFYDAARDGDLAKVRELLRRKRELISVTPYHGDNTPLHNAAEYGRKDVVEFLLASGADANAKNDKGETPLDLAKSSFREGAKDIIELLLPHTKRDPGKAICEAATEGSLDGVKELLNEDPQLVFSKDGKGRTLLHLAALEGREQVAEFLLSKRVGVNARDSSGETPLHCAARRYSTDMVDILVANGADVNARDGSGGTPLHGCDSVRIAEALLTHKADLNARTNSGWAALDVVVYQGQGHENIIEFLRQKGGREYVRKPDNPFSRLR